MSPKKKPAARVGRTSRFHLDRRAAHVASSAGDDDELLTSQDLADWLGVSIQWVNLQRTKGEGPEYERLGARMIRYRRGKVRRWLDGRSYLRTNEYAQP
jgi:predicted DNA-binding transcriptional regulator AlpA